MMRYQRLLSGSSREGAVYALVDAGVRCVAAPSFGDIFAGDAGKNGLLLLSLPDADTAPLRALPDGTPAMVDLPAQTLTARGVTLRFTIDPFRKRMLLEGLDDIGLTLALGDALAAWAAQDAAARPWVVPAQP